MKRQFQGYSRERYFHPKEDTELSEKNEQIDGAFLCKSYRMITPKELEELLLMDYNIYMRDYYKCKIPKFYKEFYEQNWFKNRYLKPDNNISQFFNERLEIFIYEKANKVENISLDQEVFDYKLIDYPSHNYIVRWKDQNRPVDEIKDFMRKCPGFLNFSIYVDHYKSVYKLLGMLSLENEIDGEESINFLKELSNGFDFENFVISESFCSKSNLCVKPNDNEDVMKIIEMFRNKYGIESEKIYALVSGKSLDFCILLLRYVFNYCYYCVKQFDSDIEMIKECGDYHVRTGDERSRSVFDRKNKILLVDKKEIFEELKIKTYDRDILSNSIKCKNDEGHYKCNICKKTCDSEENIKNHIVLKHPEIVNEIKKSIDDYNLFIDNIDLKLLSNIEGTERWTIPFFILACNVNERRNQVVYKMTQVFSGDIKIERNSIKK